IILFLKGCPNPSCPICAATTIFALAQVAIALARRQPPCQGVATPAASAAAPTGIRVGRGRQPLLGALQSVPFAGTVLQAGVPAGVALQVGVPAGRPQQVVLASVAPAGCCPHKRCRPPLRAGPGRTRSPPCRGPWPRPCRGWPPLLLAAFTAKTQQERVERFYVIQSHHTQFKTNLSHENIGSDTTVGKP
ncbi:hypothetical protein BHE74_00038281, partial [Ensete ventricosum]